MELAILQPRTRANGLSRGIDPRMALRARRVIGGARGAQRRGNLERGVQHRVVERRSDRAHAGN